MATILGNNNNLHISSSNTDIEDSIIDSYFGPKGGNVTVYADYRDIIFDPLVGVNNSSTSLSNVTIHLAPNNITLGNGNNLVYGNYRDLSMSVVGQTANSTGTYNTIIDGTNILLGGNHIVMGSGTSTVFGSMRDLSMSVTGGTALSLGTGGVTVNTLIENTTIDLTGGGVGNTITVGNASGSGNTIVYGNMRDFTMTAGGSTAISDTTFATSPNAIAITEINNLHFKVGNNTINLGNGNNTVFGDMHELSINLVASSAYGFNTIAAGNTGNALAGALAVDLGASQAVPAANLIPSYYDFSSNKIAVGNGSNVIFGHLQTLDIESVAGTAVSPGTTNAGPGYVPSSFWVTSYFSPDQPYSDPGLNWVAGAVSENECLYKSVIMESNDIKAGLGTNTIYGDFQNLSINLSGGSSTGSFPNTSFGALASLDGLGPFAGTYESFSFYAMAGNNIKVGIGGYGVNTVYGTSQDLLFECKGGINNQGYAQGNGIGGDTFVFGGTGFFDYEAFTANFTVTGNKIATGNGINTVFGDLRDIISVFQNGIENGLNLSLPADYNGAASSTGFTGNQFYGGLNNIVTGNGTNTVYGGMRDLSLTNIGGTGENLIPTSYEKSQSQSGPLSGNFIPNTILPVVSTGANNITVGAGTNNVYGSFRNITLIAEGGYSESTPYAPFPGAFIGTNQFEMGHNVINAGLYGWSVNKIYGDGLSVNYELEGGHATQGLVASNSIRSNNLSIGHNIIHAGDGLNIIYGDVQSINYSLQGGVADGAGSQAFAFMRSNSIDAGGNDIHVGAGCSTVYGDAQSMSFSIHGGTVTNGGILNTAGVNNVTDGSAHMINTPIKLAGNTIEGGLGNDILYVHLDTLSFSAINGTVDGVSAGKVPGVGDAGAYFSGNVFISNGGVSIDRGSSIFFGNDTVNGGGGNDTIISSDVLNLNGVDAFLKPAGYSGPVTWHNNLDGSVTNDLIGSDKNTITFGDEMLTGGLGNDQFVFTLLNGGTKVVANQGSAEITDFNGSGSFDKLVLHTSLISEHTAAALDADHVATFTNSAAGTLISFNGAGSIMLDHVTYTSFVNMGAHLVVA